jgi:hypothetical protein
MKKNKTIILFLLIYYLIFGHFQIEVLRFHIDITRAHNRA